MLAHAERSFSGIWLVTAVAFLIQVPIARAQDAGIEAVPVVSSFTPAGGPTGTLVYISGSGFTGATTVRFNGRSTSFSVTNDGQITATVPTGATTGTIGVTTPGGTGTSTSNFYVGSAPTISVLSPGYGPTGTLVTITGTEFTGALSVTFGGHPAAFTVQSTTVIKATVPGDAVTGSVAVTNPAGTGTSGALFYLPPIITGFTPAGGPVGAAVVITGSGFAITSGVAFNGVGASFSVSSNSQITTWVPGGATTGPITVSSPAGSGPSALNFFVGDVPSIASFAPAGGPVGMEITIYGGGFDGIADVTFSGVPSTFVVDNLNQLRAVVPAGATSGPLAISNPSGTGTSSASFFVGSLPQITLIAPPFGPAGVPVVITGSGFTGVSLVDFNGTSAPFNIVNDSEITTAVPLGATTGYLHIVNPAGADTSNLVFGISPAITTFDPSCVGSINRDTTHVVILGTNFSGATSVRLNDVEATFVVESGQQVRAGIPAGDVDGLVSVTTPYGTAVSAASFRIIQLQPPPHVAGQEWPHDPNQNVAAAMVASTQQNLVSVPDGVGGVIEVWEDNRDGTWDIYAQRITVYGAIASGWPASGLPVCISPADQTAPTAAADGAGGVLIAWRDNRNDGGDIYALHVLNDGTVDATWPQNGVAVCTAPNEQSAPVIAADRSCGAFIAWQDLRTGQWDIYAQHVTALGAMAQGWGVNGNPICTQGNHQITPSIAEDRAGGALITWSDQRCGQVTFAQRVLVDGSLAPGWPANGAWASDYCASQYYPQIAPDGVGGAFVVWRDDRCYYNAFMQHLSGTGTVEPGWSSGGNAINQYCRYGISEDIRITSDGSGGAYVCWGERAGFGQSDVMVQRMLPNAQVAAGWPAYGLRLTNDSPDQISPEMVPDGYGGVIVTWRDVRAGSWDIYAHRVMASGVTHPAWTAGGMRVSSASGDQIDPTIVPASNGTAIVSWRDSRFGSYRIFAQLLDGSGRLGNPSPAITQVADVPADQGGMVRIRWSASYLDTLPTLEIGSYGIWRQVSGQAAAAAMKAGARMVRSASTAEDARPGVYREFASASSTTYWEGVGAILARGFATYTFVAPTLVDSSAAGNALTTHMVDAHAAFFPYFWSSAPDSGYSVDNLPPGQPAGFAAVQVVGGIRVHWTPNIERDLAGYRVHRGSDPDFQPAESNLVIATTDTAYTDGAGSAGTYYRLLAVDTHGNASSAALAQAEGVAGIAGRIPTELSFGPAIPNPARDRCVFRLAMPTRQFVSLRIYDAAGRSVRTLLDNVLDPGEPTVTWDGRDDHGHALSSGVYLARLNVLNRTIRRRFVVVR